MRNLGLIGGLGPGATVHYYNQLTKGSAGEMLIVQADMALVRAHVQRGDREALASYFASLVERMALGGAELAAISAVTPHICIRELEKISPLPLVNIIDVLAREIRARGYKRISLFGTRFVVESRMFGMLDGVEIVVPAEVDTIDRIYFQTVEGRTDGRAELSRIAHSLDVDAVILAGTDLALIFDETNTDFPHVDAARLHVQAILDALR